MEELFFDVLTGAWKTRLLIASVKNGPLPPRIQKALDRIYPQEIKAPHMARQMERMAEHWKGLPDKREVPHGTEEDYRIYMEAQEEKAGFSLNTFLELVDLAGVRRLLDVGGGTAPYLRGIQKKFPDIAATYMDIESAAALAREKGLQGEIIAGDFRDLPWGENFDFILISQVIHMYGDDSVRLFFNKAAGALTEKGRLAIIEHFVDPWDDPYNFLFDINMFLGTDGGKCRTRQEVLDLAPENFAPEREYMIDKRTGVLELRLVF
ncbi:MAG: methyltransferase [Nitrospinae bacterium]|nr:methyltransferase [Nitrospinota bacterium]